MVNGARDPRRPAPPGPRPGGAYDQQMPNGQATRTDLNALALPDLYRHFAATGLVRRLLELARDEDLGVPTSRAGGRARLDPHAATDHARAGGDITTAACIEPDQMGEASLVARQAGTIAGLECIGDLLELFAPGSGFEPGAADGRRVAPGTTLGVLRGPLDEILELERTMLNLLARLCGVATQTSRFLDAMNSPGPVKARLYDTRKTTPGLRVLEKYAVRCGGGHLHRIGLYDAVLIKDNHIADVTPPELPAFVEKAAAGARQTADFIEVEVDSLEQLRSLLTLPPGTIDIVLLDNMPPEQLREAVARRDSTEPSLQLEASGGVTLESIAAVARTGVDRIAVGALTHSAVGLDVALDIVPHL
jgi:nicotinate-nucleotide pyrophosphorylase (carboxylating)